MTNEELKKKIVEILKAHIYIDNYGLVHRLDYAEIADALIAAGIGDVKEEKFEADHYWNMWQGALVELERAERRAEVYYEALLSAAAYGDTPPEYYIEQAEKELAEEGKDD